MNRIIGLDVCKSSVVGCLLTFRPDDPQSYFYDAKFHDLPANISGVQQLLELKPDIAIMEPTGTNYSKLWVTHLNNADVEVRLVDHVKLRGFRKNYLALPDKNDSADALALACYGWDYQNNLGRFLKTRIPAIAKLRDFCYRLEHLNRLQNPIINRLKQDLSWQFPEVAGVHSVRRGNLPPLLFAWIAGEEISARYENLYSNSVGLGLTEITRSAAQRLCQIAREEWLIEQEIGSILNQSRFLPYRQVFQQQFGFGIRTEAIILSQIYPLENFLAEDGQPEVRIRPGRESGKPTKRHISRRKFEKALGVAPAESSSGDRVTKRTAGGSELCRKAMWRWLFTRIEVKRNRPKNHIGQRLGEKLDREKQQKRPIKLIRSRCCGEAARILFYELVKCLQ
ncbi:MAG: IS110 family transposase [Kamptonema sp. SIO1D9]|nr:IS110 family transposase [Kamptonema sp. SIO1D9]